MLCASIQVHYLLTVLYPETLPNAKAENVDSNRMKKLYIIIVLILFSFQTSFSQTKEIKGDTAFWYKKDFELQKTLGLKDFSKSNDEFNFRFRNQGQIIEISKDSSKYSGSITNYIYHAPIANRNKIEILSNKITLSPKQSEDIYNIVQKSRILDLLSSKDIKDWKRGADGITYIIEHSDKKKYWLKNYWTPSAQGSIPEAIIVSDLVKDLSDTLNLPETYSSFEKTLPKKGCYNSGGISTMCYVSNSLTLGYSGATKLPFGFYSSYSSTYLGKLKINSSVALQYNFDNDGFHHLNIGVAKWEIFHKKSTLSDFLIYNYQNRIVKVDDVRNKFENHQIKYGLNLKKNIGFGVGLDYLAGIYARIGAHLYGYKGFSKPNLSTTLTTSIFDNRVNYKAEVFKSFNFNNKFLIQGIVFGLAYEDFMSYKDLYFIVRVWL